MSSGELHLDRARAESFGAVARQYERYRPTYPDALLDDLATLRPARVLDVGCGAAWHWIDPELGMGHCWPVQTSRMISGDHGSPVSCRESRGR